MSSSRSMEMAGRSGGFIVAGNRDRLIFKFFRVVEGKAEGRFAISALVILVIAALLVSFTLYGLFHG